MRLDVAGQILAPPSDHPRLVWPEPTGEVSRAAACAVPGCQRSAGSHGLCRSHRSGQLLRRMSVQEFITAPTRSLLARFSLCQVAACPRDRCGGQVASCEAHQARWLRHRRAEPELDELRWRATTSPIVVTGQVSLAGMPPLITAQVLYGLRQRTRSGAHTRIEVLRRVVEELRRSQADSVDALAHQRLARRGLLVKIDESLLETSERAAQLPRCLVVRGECGQLRCGDVPALCQDLDQLGYAPESSPVSAALVWPVSNGAQ